ncbi:translation initiation factor IF-6 [Candidatus Bathyarchaeota archaeon]|nr:translation initiation factor IF-6 [Candidatus Bathyarchaeota archaeon]
MTSYLAILRFNLLGNPNIGVYALTTNEYTLLPTKNLKGKIKRLSEFLKGRLIPATIGGTRLLGVLAAANSNGIVLPNFIYDDEMRAMKNLLDTNVGRIKSKINAFGNLILANDHGGIVGKNLMQKKKIIHKIEDILNIELVHSHIAGLPYVGSLAVATNTGVLAHPLLRDDEKKVITDVLKVRVNLGTINGGNPFISSGILANDHGAIISHLTTGPEIMTISNLFGV